MFIRRSVVKNVLGLTTACGSGAIIGIVAASVIPPQARPLMKLSMNIAAVAMGGMVGEAVGSWTENTVDQFADIFSGATKLKDEVIVIAGNLKSEGKDAKPTDG